MGKRGSGYCSARKDCGGYDGDQGPQDIQGAQGPANGFQGNQGNQGLQGIQGTQGTQGAGVQGAQGFQGTQGAGFQGVQGVQGNQGTPGSASLAVGRTVFLSSSGNDGTGQVQNPGLPFLTLQAAVNAAVAAMTPGQTWLIYAEPGTYGAANIPANINIDGSAAAVVGPLTFTGAGPNTVQNVTIIGGSPAVIISNGATVTIMDTQITGAGANPPANLITVTNGTLNLSGSLINYQPTFASGSVTVFSISGGGVVTLNCSSCTFNYSTTVVGGTVQLVNLTNTNSNSVVKFSDNNWNVNLQGTTSTFNVFSTNINTFSKNTFVDELYNIIGNATNSLQLFNALGTVGSSTVQGVTVRNTTFAGYSAGQNPFNTLTLQDIHWIDIQAPLLTGPLTQRYTSTDTNGSTWYSGGESVGIKTVTGPLTLDDSSRTVIVLNSNTTVTLPPAANQLGRLIMVRPNTGVSDVQILPTGGDTINSTIQYTIFDERDSIEFQSDGISNWSRVTLAEPLVNPHTNNTFYSYISPTGNDENSGLYPSQPVATLTRALEVVEEYGWNHAAVISFAAGTYTLPIAESYRFKSSGRGANGQSICMIGAPLATVTSQTVTGFDYSALALSGMIAISVVGPLVPGAYRGLAVQYTSGTLDAKYYQIADNTATQFYLLTSDAPVIGDTFNVLQNTTVINAFGNKFIEFALVIQNIDFVMTDPDPALTYSIGIGLNVLIMDNVRFLAAPGSTIPTLEFFSGSNFDSSQMSIVANDINSQNLGVSVDGTTAAVGIAFIEVSFYISANKFSMNKVSYQRLSCAGTTNTFYYMSNSLGFTITGSTSGINNLAIVGGAGVTVSSQSAFTTTGALMTGIAGTIFTIGPQSTFGISNAVVGGDGTGVFFNVTNSSTSFSNMSINNTGSGVNQISGGSIVFNNFTYTGNSSFNFQNDVRVVMELTTFNNINSALPALQFITATMSSSTSLTIYNNTGGGASLDARFSQINLETFNLNNSTKMNIIEESVLSVNNLVHTNVTGVHTGYDSQIEVHGQNDNADVSWNVDHCVLDLGNIIHVGPLTNPYITADNYSTVFLNDSSLTGTGQIILSLLTGAAVDFDTVTLDGCVSIAYTNPASAVASVLLNGVNADNVTGAPFNLIKSSVYMNNCNISRIVGSNSSIYDNCNVTKQNCTLDNGNNPGGISITNASSLNLYGCTISNSTTDSITLTGSYMGLLNTNINSSGAGARAVNASNACRINISGGTFTGVGSLTGIDASNTRFSIANLVINGYGTGLIAQRVSSGTIDALTGNSTTGVNLISGARFSTANTNTIGAVTDVIVGALGARTWVQVNAGAAADTNDSGAAFPQYVNVVPN